MTILRGRLDDPGSSSRMTRGSSVRTTSASRARVRFGSMAAIRSVIARIRALPSGRADALLAGALFAEGAAEVLLFPAIDGAQVAVVLAMLAVQAVLLAFRRRVPLLALVV